MNTNLSVRMSPKANIQLNTSMKVGTYRLLSIGPNVIDITGMNSPGIICNEAYSIWIL